MATRSSPPSFATAGEMPGGEIFPASMCENPRQRVIHISNAAAVIFLALRVASAANGG